MLDSLEFVGASIVLSFTSSFWGGLSGCSDILAIMFQSAEHLLTVISFNRYPMHV